VKTTTRILFALLLAALVLVMPAAFAAKKATYVYVHDDGSPQRVFAYELAKDGTLTAVPGSPFTATADGNGCGGYCQTMAYSKKRKMLFHGSSTGLTVWSVAKDGSLTEVAGSPFALHGDDLWGTEVIEKGKRVTVYAGSYDNDRTTAVEIAKDGTATPLAGSPYAAGNSALGLDIAKNKVVVVANQSGDPLSSYLVGKGGVLTPGPANTGSNPDRVWTVDVGPKGKFAYTGSDALRVHSIDKKTGAVTLLETEQPDLGLGSNISGVTFSKKVPSFVFAYENDGNDVRAVRRNKDGTLTPLGDGPQATGIPTFGGVAFAPDGKTLVAGGYDEGGRLKTFAVDKKTGALTELDAADLPGEVGNLTDIAFVKR
jgi:6-phosphogluconolactonase (cycloisomerase 2 family)